MADIILPHFLDLLGVTLHLLLPKQGTRHRFEEARIERLGLPGSVQTLSQLPRLEDRLDLGHEVGNLGTEGGILFGGFEEVDEFLLDEVLEGLVRAELVLDSPGCLALLYPDFLTFRGRTLALGEKLRVQIGVGGGIVGGEVGTFVRRDSNEASFIAASLDDMELPAPELRVSFQPLSKMASMFGSISVPSGASVPWRKGMITTRPVIMVFLWSIAALRTTSLPWARSS